MYAINTDLYERLKDGEIQIVRISVTPTTGDAFVLTEADIIAGSFEIDRYCASGSTMEIGSAIAAELSFNINNTDGGYNDKVFEGAELFVQIGAYNELIPIGYFTVDNVPRKLTIMSIMALDRMVRFDKTYVNPLDDTTTSITVERIIRDACDKCNVTLFTNPSIFSNATYAVSDITCDLNTTYRQIVQWAFEILGVCGYMDWTGRLRFGWYNKYSNGVYADSIYYINLMYDYQAEVTAGTKTEADLTALVIEVNALGILDFTVVYVTGNFLFVQADSTINTRQKMLDYMAGFYPTSTITSAERFTSDVQEKAITITGIQITDDADLVYLGAGSDEQYMLNVAGNGLLHNAGGTDTTIVDSNIQTIANNIYTLCAGTTYTPYECTAKPYPQLYPLDAVLYKNAGGTYFASYVTHINFKLNGKNKIKAIGETSTSKGYAAANPITRGQAAIIEAISKNQNERLNSRAQELISLNELVSAAFGLYSSSVTQTDGSVKYYLHNAKTKETSSIIYTMTANGLAWTTSGWNNGSPAWSSGITAEGNAIFNQVNATGVNVASANTLYETQITPEDFAIKYNGVDVIRMSGDVTTLTSITATKKVNIGKVRFVPRDNGADLVVLD